jgi:uncharacterized repeat protein (TIGR01451 family)
MPPISTVPPSITIYESSASTANGNDLSPYTTSPTRFIGLDNLRDQIVLFDGVDTIVDFVEYANEGNINAPFTNSVPYVLPPAGASEGNQYSYERCPATADTNNAKVDFLPHDTFGFEASPPTPGALCPAATGVDLEIRSLAQPPTVLAGGTVNFFIEWSNLGGGAFSSVIVTDTLPANITLLGQSSKPAAAFTPSPGPGQPMQWNFTNLTTNVSGTIVLTATVNPSAPANIPLVNRAGVRSNDINRVEDVFKLGNNFTTAEVIPSKPDMAVSSTWPGGAPAGDDVEFVITYANNGAGAASSVFVTDTLPSGVTFISSDPPPSTISGQQHAWDLGDLDPQGSGTISVIAHIGNSLPVNTPLNNVINVGATPADDPGAMANNTETRILVVGAKPDLAVNAVGWPAKASPGTQFCYTINYSYPQGAIPANGVTIKSVLPFELTLVSQNSGLTFSTNGNTLTWTRAAALPVNGSGSFQVCVRVRSNIAVGQTVQNVITITGSVDPDPNDPDGTKQPNTRTFNLEIDKYKIYMPIVRR